MVMNRLWLGTIAAAALLASGGAQAADLPVKAPPVAPVAAPIVNWSGFYIGGNVGIAWSRDLFTFNIPDGGCGTACEDFRFTPSSFIGGGQVGFQSQVEKWVFGIEATWSGLDLHGSRQSVLLPDPTLVSFKIDDIATAVARFGYAWDHAMFYAKAGYAAARVGIHAFDTVSLATGDDRAWRSGWTLGAGIEYMVVPSVVLGLEFDFYNLQFDNKQTVGFSDGTTFQISGSNADIYAVTARLSYLFNWGKTPAAVVAKY
jgi:outer membrane immunogenic protein